MDAAGFVQILGECSFPGWEFRLGVSGTDATWLQVSATGVCAATGIPYPWKGRKWLLSQHMTRSEVVQTALMAVLAATEHEARERFRYRGHAIFGPHFAVERLVDLCASGATEVRAERRA